MQNNLLNLASIAPMAILGGFALLMLAVSLFARTLSYKFYAVITILALALGFGLVFGYNSGIRGLFDVMLVDGIATLSMLIMLAGSIFFIFLSLGARSAHEYHTAEFFVLFLFVLVGYEFMVASESLMMILVGLETGSLALYTLIALHNRARSVEAALKYFIMGALGSGFFAFGAAMFFLSTGSMEISNIAQIAKSSNLQTSVLLFAACSFMIVSIGFKLSLIPFHTWTPDVYEGASSAMAGFMSVVPKIAGFVVAIRLFEALGSIGVQWLNIVLYVVAVVTMSLANLMALVQRDVKRMLAFSSVSHAGFVLCAIVIGSTQANAALFTYWILYAVANLGAFAFIWCVRQRRARSLNLKFKTQSVPLNLNANSEEKENFISNTKLSFSQNHELADSADELNLGGNGQNLACGERSFKASEQNSKENEQNFKASEPGAEATLFGTETCEPGAEICAQSSNFAARFEHQFEKFDGLICTHPLFALCAAIFMLSLAGIPPFSVFWGKMYLLSAAVNSGYFALAVIMAVNSALALYYYLRLIVRMFLHEPREDAELDGSLSAVSVQIKFAVVLASVACVLAPFLVKFLTGAVNNFVFLSGY
ncbi:NADH-quinone oxidoreductase subunit N [Campylobacter gracilis]|uniref:NADH-quinone oxidoreductase subunit N n=2 Tax=Campylobacter TaxID=194 RepID=C8PF34_9BACT|nr:NADH-quinone oxidoreductase subunit N [Campylobacter gracilis]AKT91790.1 NADH:quinone oxidoreductase I, membrane subunit N [Campylobacter gracilis]EEV18662.1 proton-translocating NADH-quinone oxidoreductase, chain N [Campylobacter gracilis RM3268]UEB46001.1 NADH-quinone oxidoreductase subunit N [Campylobacter gracilis]SUW77756.1 NADH dehydrogenase subunit N [Campylobacter gracilis]